MDAPLATAARPPTGRKMKARAPPPPGKPAAQREQKTLHDAVGSQQSLVHMKEASQNSPLDITVVLPSGLEKQSVVSGSHAMMDLLVELCLQNHLNPSHHVLEIWSSETQQPLSFKPNTLVGSLNMHTVFLKEKVPEEKIKPGLPKVPEKSVRLVVNYLRTQKAVVRVSPDVPLQNILPVICAKCEVSPDHVVLLRDSIAGEELELSKSLNELGIKELYAWDNRRETFRKSSLNNDETDKEKKNFWDFSKLIKEATVEHLGQSGADSDEDALKPVSGRGMNGCLTTPNSPSMHSGSLTLGPSLSLGNISGVSMKSEMKKRRAPPPPSPGLLSQDKASEKTSFSSQVDLQKKKRQAPAPPLPQAPLPQAPPPSPVVPTRLEDKEENRKSTVGVGRQVPQKPPRGAIRGLPQLVLPPPPPYPPPDTDVAEPVSSPEEGAGSKTSELKPKLSLPLGPGSHCSVDGVPHTLPETEATASVGSCFASEDTTEDSGVISSPSDIISLDSQHDSVKSKDKWSTDQEDCSDQDLAVTPELGPQKSPSWGRNGSRNSHLKPEQPATPRSNGEDLLTAGQIQQTLAELDEDLEEMEDSYETDTSSLTNSINGVSNHCLQEAIIYAGDSDVIPVTFIGEVSDDPMDSGFCSNRNNNAGSLDMRSVVSERAGTSPQQAEHSQAYARTSDIRPDPSLPSQNISKGIQCTLANVSEDRNPVEMGPKLTSFISRLHTDDLNAQKSNMHGSARSETSQAIHRVNPQPVSPRDSEVGKSPAWGPPLWTQHGQPTGGSYGLKYGLTTYKIVPPKSEMKCYDRGVSLSTGAIKIDEQGNLVSPHVNSKTISQSSAIRERETPPLGKVKEFWRGNSMERHRSQLADSSAKRTSNGTATAMPVKLQGDKGLKAARTWPTPQQQPAPQEREARLEEGRTQPPSAVTHHVRVPSANTSDVTFLKPQRRTSSQYMASAIAKRMGPLKGHPDVARPQDNAGKSHEIQGPKLAAAPPTLREDAAPSLSEERPHEQVTKQPSIYLPSHPGAASPVGDHLRGEVSNGKSSTQDCPEAVHRSSSFLPVMSSQKDQVSVGRSCGFNKKQSASIQKASSASDPMHTLRGECPPSPHWAEALSSRKALVNGSVWAPGNSGPPHSPKEACPASHVTLEADEKPCPLSAHGQVTDSTLPHSIFGPKKKFKPIVQKPVPKDTSLHSALMEAIHTSGGKDRLRKTTEPTLDGRPKKPSYMETESERSALLAAIRGHSGTDSLRKVSSLASEELQSLRDAALLAPRSENPQQEHVGLPLPPALPPPTHLASQDPSASKTASRLNEGTLSSPVDAREALMDAIRSGTGAARLRKVPLLV